MISNKKDCANSPKVKNSIKSIMPNDQKEMGLVDWVQVRTFTDLLHHNDSLGTDEKPHNPIFALFPTAKGPCIHERGWSTY